MRENDGTRIGFQPTREELHVLFQYWAAAAVHEDFATYTCGPTGSNWTRRYLAWCRLRQLRPLLGRDCANRDFHTLIEEYGALQDPLLWERYWDGVAPVQIEQEMRGFRPLTGRTMEVWSDNGSLRSTPRMMNGGRTKRTCTPIVPSSIAPRLKHKEDGVQNKFKLFVRRFDSRDKNSLKGIFDLAITITPELELRINRCTYHEQNGKRWIAFPAQQFGNGFAQFLEVNEAAKGDFRNAAVAAIDAFRAAEGENAA